MIADDHTVNGELLDCYLESLREAGMYVGTLWAGGPDVLPADRARWLVIDVAGRTVRH